MKWIALVLLVACRAPMTPADYTQYRTSIDRRNQERWQSALAVLQRRGYEVVRDTAAHHAYLDNGAREWCTDQLYHLERSGVPKLAPADRVPVKVDEVGVTALVGDACRFFDEQSSVLDVVRPDGSTDRLVVIDEHRVVAKGAHGELVRLALVPHVIEHHVVVRRSCNLMPRAEPDPVEKPWGRTVAWAADAKLPAISLAFDREDVHVDCTDNVY